MRLLGALWLLIAAASAAPCASAQSTRAASTPERPAKPANGHQTGPAPGKGSSARADDAQAKPLPHAVVLATSGAQANATALDSVIQGALDELHVVTITARPGMDLGAVQLALDCVSETAPCLRAVTAQHSADILVAPSLARTSGELVLSFLRFDARNAQMRRVLRRQAGHTLTSATLDVVPDMLRELFELPPKPKQEPIAEAAPKPAESPQQPSAAMVDETAAGLAPLPEAPMEPPSSARSVPVGPILLAGGGALIVGAGVIFGVMVHSAQDDYNRTLSSGTPDRSLIDHALDRASTGRTDATLANVFYGVGGAALIASGIWLVVELSQHSERTYDEPQVRLQPLVGPRALGLVFTQRGAGL